MTKLNIVRQQLYGRLYVIDKRPFMPVKNKVKMGFEVDFYRSLLIRERSFCFISIQAKSQANVQIKIPQTNAELQFLYIQIQLQLQTGLNKLCQQQMPETTIPKVNPWTGQKSKPKTDGMFFSLLAHHYPHLDQSTSLQRNYIKLSTLIQSPRQQPSLKQYKQLLNIQQKLSKIQQLLQWIQVNQVTINKTQPPSINQSFANNSQAQSSNVNSQRLRQSEANAIPIDSSYVYLPLHSGQSSNVNSQRLRQSEANVIPIDSSYVYLPLHSGTVFHQLLKQASTLHWEGLVHERMVKKVQREVKQMEDILKLNDEIIRNVII